MPRRAAKIDGNQSEIVDAYRAHGYLVKSTAMVGEGFPDLIVWRSDHGYLLIEVKMPKGKLRKKQISFQDKGWPVTEIRDASEVV